MTTTELQRWLLLPTAAISDALDRHRIAGQVFGIRPLVPQVRFAGPAFTIRMLPVGVSGGTVGDYIDEVPPGHIVVIDNNARMDASAWGGILTITAQRRGVAGTVVDGICRDVAHAAAVEYPLFARAAFMRTGKDRIRVTDVQATVSIGGVAVDPDDVVIGDADGVVVVPRLFAERIAEAALDIEAREQQIVSAVRGGTRLDAARAKAGYHHLQRPHST
jgi:4-hydroxy-4-methyl-2-oxoglutarate aldolase